MYQRRLVVLFSALMLGVTGHVFAQDGKPPTELEEATLIEQQSAQNQVLSHKMMGHISLAQLALDVDLPDQAREQIRRAQGIESTLSKQLPNLHIDSSFRYGKVTHNGTQTLSQHYIPVVDDVFLISDYSAIYTRAKALDLNESWAGVMHVGVSLDLREVHKALEDAANQIDKSDDEGASKALEAVFRGAIFDEEELDDPKLAISENLALAKSFVDHARYDSARLTLERVQDRLEGAKNAEFATIDQSTVAQFSTELQRIRADLHKKDPSLLERASDRLADLGDSVRSWFD